MAIDKGLYAAPLGMEQLAMEEEPLEIAIEDPESVEIGIGGTPILRIEEAEESDDDFSANLAEYMS